MHKIRVVLIEDHELIRMGLKTVLSQQAEIEILGEAANGHDGLILLKTLQPDIAIVDIGLPLKDGIELTREVKAFAQREDLNIKVLVLTSYDNKETVLAAFAAGANSYCMKDIKPDSLWEAVQNTYCGNAWIDPAIARIVLQHAKKNLLNLPSATPEVSIGTYSQEPEENQDFTDTSNLTERELEVLQLIVEGCSNAAIGQKLHITVGTVKNHVRNILGKLSADDRTQAAVHALRSGLVV